MFSFLGVVQPFDANHRLVTSSLYSTRTLAFQRLVIAAYSVTTLITSLVYESVVIRQGNIWFSYFTHLSIIGISVYFVVSTYHGFKYKPSPSSSYTFPLQRWHKALQALHILLLSTITTFPILVTICYWALLASPVTFSTPYNTWSSVSLHILNTAFALSEIATTNIPPLPWVALPACLILLFSYLGLAYITHANQGIYTYTFLDPKTQHSKVAAYIIGVVVGEVIIFAAVHYTITLRDRLSRFSLYCDQDVQQQGTKEALEEWEEVQWVDAVQKRESAGSSSQGPASQKLTTEVKTEVSV